MQQRGGHTVEPLLCVQAAPSASRLWVPSNFKNSGKIAMNYILRVHVGEQHEMQHEHIVLRDFMPFHQSHVWLHSRSVVVRLVFFETLGSRYRNPYKSYSFGFLQLNARSASRHGLTRQVPWCLGATSLVESKAGCLAPTALRVAPIVQGRPLL